MNIRAEFLVGKQSGNDWSGVYGYRPEDGSNSTTEFFCVVRLKTDAVGVELEIITKMLLDEFQDVYYNFDQEEDEIVKLEESLQKMKAKLEVIVSREGEILEKGLDIEMTLALLNQDTLIVGIIGDSKILIYRNGKLVDISKGLVDASMLGFVRTGSLKLEPTDRTILTTSNPFNKNLDSLQLLAETLNINLVQDLAESKGTSIMVLGDQNLEWESNPFVVEPIAEEDSPEYIEEPQERDSAPKIVSEINVPDQEFFVEDDMPEQDLEVRSERPSPEFIVDEEIRYEPDNKLAAFREKVSANVNVGFRNLKNRFANLRREKTSIDDIYEEDLSAQQVSILDRVKSTFYKTRDSITSSNNGYNSNKTYVEVIRRTIQFLSNSFKNIVSLFRKEVLGSNLNRLDKQKNMSRVRRNRIILLILVIGLISLIYLTWRDADIKRQESERIELASANLNRITNEVNQSINQVEIVKTQEQSKRDILNTKLNTLLTSVENQRVENLFLSDLDALALKLQAARDSLSYIKEVNANNIQVVSDISSLFPTNKPSDLVLANGNLYVSDSGRNVVYRIAPIIGATPTEVVKDLKEPYLLVKNAANNVVVYDLEPSSAMGILNTQTSEFSRFSALSPAIIGSVKEVAIYGGNDALYELHQNHQQIFKRDKLSNSYTGGGALYVTINPPNWRTDPEFAKAIDISVPYEIYVLLEGGGLRRYLAGGNNTLTFQTFENFSQVDFDSLRQASAIDVDGKYLAVADPRNKRVLVFEIIDNDQKNLRFLQQFIFRGSESNLQNIKELAVDESSGSIYVLDGSKVIKLTL